MPSTTPFHPAADLLELEVADVQALTPQVRRLRLRRPDGAPLPGFGPGAHLRVALPAHTGGEGSDGGDAFRCYSLVNPGEDPGVYEIAVKLEEGGRGGSRYMHGLAPGQRLRTGPPRNDFPLAEGPHEALLIAGGIGITPIYAMARALQAGARPYTLHYSARSPALMPYRADIEALCGERAQLRFDGGDPQRGLPLAEVLGAPSAQRHVYVCGPRPLIDATLAEATRLGWPRERVHFELFAGPAPAATDAPVTVTLARSGKTLQVAAGQTILDAMRAGGCDPFYDCQRGECGVCALKLLEGQAEHRDYALSDEERAEGMVCVCVSRATTAAITLDA